MATKVKVEPEEEVRLSTSGGGAPMPELEEKSESGESMESNEIDDEFITNYCKSMETIQLMTVSKELFYMDEMVAQNYARLSKPDKEWFDQMKELAEAIKKETGDYSLIEDLMAQVVGKRFGGMTSGDLKAVMGKEGEGAKAGRRLKQEGSRLVIKGEPRVEAEKVVISAIVPSEEPTLLPYCIKENEEEDCETIGSESDIEEIDKTKVRNILTELAELKRKEAECFDKLARAMPDMWDSEVVVVAKNVRGSKLPQCVYQMNERIANPRDFHATLAAGKRLYSLYKFNQTGASPISVPELCSHYDIGKTKIYELL